MSDEDYDYHVNKLPGKTYVSRRLENDLRIASKVMDSDGLSYEAVDHDRLVPRELKPAWRRNSATAHDHRYARVCDRHMPSCGDFRSA